MATRSVLKTNGSDLDHPARSARAKADSGRGWYAVLARTGLVAKGVSFGLVGALAIKLAAGSGGEATSRNGALQQLAQHSFGKIALVLLAIGFAAYAVWRFVQALAERDDEGGEKGKAKKWGKRAGYVGRGLIYAGLTFTAVKILVGSGGQQSQNQKAHKTTAAVLDWPAGRWIVGIVGLCIVGAAVWNLYRGITRKFEDKWRTGEMGETARKWGGRAGVVGHLARAVLFGLIGIFVAIPHANVIYSVLGLVVFGGFTIFDFNRLRRSNMASSVPIAASIFLDIFNIFLFMLRLFGGGRS